MPNKRLRQQLKVMVYLDKFDPTIVAALRSDIPNKGYPCFIFRKSELQKMKEEYGDKLLIIGGNWEVKNGKS